MCRKARRCAGTAVAWLLPDPNASGELAGSTLVYLYLLEQPSHQAGPARLAGTFLPCFTPSLMWLLEFLGEHTIPLEEDGGQFLETPCTRNRGELLP